MEGIAMLTGEQIAAKGIVEGSRSRGERLTTYDATVGHIVRCGKEIDCNELDLPPRGIAWIVSEETFNVPSDATGLATLRTTWTHDGVLALNVGVVDPGWKGPLAAAVVNFSNSDFVIKKGDGFLRLMFHDHVPVDIKKPSSRDHAEYLSFIVKQSKIYSKTFLNMEALVPEVTREIFSVPKFVINLTRMGIIIGTLAILVPVAYTVYSDAVVSKYKLENIETRLKIQREELDPADRIAQLESRISRLEKESLGNASSPVGANPATRAATSGSPQAE